MKLGRLGRRMVAAGVLGMAAIPASAMWSQAPWVNGRPDFKTGDMVFDGCLRPGVESSCRRIESRSQRTDLAGRPTGGEDVRDYNVLAVSPRPAYDRRIVVVAHRSTARARICGGGEAIEITNWYYKSDGPPCPARPWSPFEDD